MRIRVFAAGSNPAIDKPIKSPDREHVDWQVKLGVMRWLDRAKTTAEYVSHRHAYSGPMEARKQEFSDSATIDNRRGWTWKPKDSGGMTVMQLVRA